MRPTLKPFLTCKTNDRITQRFKTVFPKEHTTELHLHTTEQKPTQPNRKHTTEHRAHHRAYKTKRRFENPRSSYVPYFTFSQNLPTLCALFFIVNHVTSAKSTKMEESSRYRPISIAQPSAIFVGKPTHNRAAMLVGVFTLGCVQVG